MAASLKARALKAPSSATCSTPYRSLTNVLPLVNARPVQRASCIASALAGFPLPFTPRHGTPAHSHVAVSVEAPTLASRRLVAATPIMAPPEAVWRALTDYEQLGTFIPGLVENRCLRRHDKGAVLYQVGAQDVALGVQFKAACTLDIREHPQGLPPQLCSPPGPGGAASHVSGRNGGGGGGGGPTYPWPSQTLPRQPVHGDITFDLLEGDFEEFKGVWRVQPGLHGAESSWLVYALHVQPRPWLPVGLMQGRISREVVSNLQAVQRHTERQHRQQRRGGVASREEA